MGRHEAPVEKPGVCHNNEPDSGLGALPEQAPFSNCRKPIGLPRGNPCTGAGGPFGQATGKDTMERREWLAQTGLTLMATRLSGAAGRLPASGGGSQGRLNPWRLQDADLRSRIRA